MDTIWKNTTVMPTFPPLDGSVRTDVLIIGGGIAGLLTAHMLRTCGVECLIIEADRICGGTTGHTTAKVTAQHGLIYAELIKRFGKERARMYLEANISAVSRMAALCRDAGCTFERRDSFVYSTCDRDALERELDAVLSMGGSAELVHDLPLPFDTVGAVRFPRQGQINPLELLSWVAYGLDIREKTPVRRLKGLRAYTDRGTVTASKIVAATHFPFVNAHGSYYLKLYQSRSYVLALTGAGDMDGMYRDADSRGLSFRSCGDVLLMGGSSHRTGRSPGWAELESRAGQLFPDAVQVCRWAAQDCMTLDRVPYIGSYSALTPDLLVATGFNKWGMTSAIIAAELLRDMILGRQSPFAELFSPSRTILRPQLAANAAEAVKSLLTPTTRRCPHMGCALKPNRAEGSWDCPCHGSRLTDDGKILEGPAVRSGAKAKR